MMKTLRKRVRELGRRRRAPTALQSWSSRENPWLRHFCRNNFAHQRKTGEICAESLLIELLKTAGHKANKEYVFSVDSAGTARTGFRGDEINRFFYQINRFFGLDNGLLPAI
jgi:hypothetical protein